MFNGNHYMNALQLSLVSAPPPIKKQKQKQKQAGQNLLALEQARRLRHLCVGKDDDAVGFRVEYLSSGQRDGPLAALLAAANATLRRYEVTRFFLLSSPFCRLSFFFLTFCFIFIFRLIF